MAAVYRLDWGKKEEETGGVLEGRLSSVLAYGASKGRGREEDVRAVALGPGAEGLLRKSNTPTSSIQAPSASKIMLEWSTHKKDAFKTLIN